MAIHSSMFAWKIPWTVESGKLESTGSQRVGHDRATEHVISLLYHLRRPRRNDTTEAMITLAPRSGFQHRSSIKGARSP